MQLIVIDPRRTEAAANADLFLQPKPGEDPTILAGILRVILDRGPPRCRTSWPTR